MGYFSWSFWFELNNRSTYWSVVFMMKKICVCTIHSYNKHIIPLLQIYPFINIICYRKNCCTGWRCGTYRYEFNVSNILEEKVKKEKKGWSGKEPSLPSRTIDVPSPPFVHFALPNKIDDLCQYEKVETVQNNLNCLQFRCIGANPFLFSFIQLLFRMITNREMFAKIHSTKRF